MIKYLEFNVHEYYALLAVEPEENGDVLTKSIDLYTEQVAGENVQEIAKQGLPEIIDKYEAFFHFALTKENQMESTLNVLWEFESAKDECLVIDGTLR